MSGVYIILNKTRSNEKYMFIKIGSSKDINKRFKQIKKSYEFNGMKDELILLQTIICNKYKKLEKTLHSLMNSRRFLVGTKHEWFKTEEEFLKLGRRNPL